MSHEPDDEYFDWEETVSAVYADVVAESDPDTGTTLQNAMDGALTRILEMIDNGDIKPDITDVVKSAIRKADQQHGKRADKLISDTRRGLLTLFDAEDDLNTVVTLGKGLRKLWRNVNGEDLLAMDELRYSNVAAQQEAYKIWRESFEPVRRVLTVHRTIESAIEADAFTADEL